jgi:hypothetical protein
LWRQKNPFFKRPLSMPRWTRNLLRGRGISSHPVVDKMAAV